jgi:hypothetical protein
VSSATARPFPLAAVFAVTITILLAALYFAVATARAAEGTIVEGPLAADQSAAGADQTSYPAATPTPVSGTGQTGSYTREPWSEEEVGGENGLSVVSSTASGTFALTGIVLDGDTGAPVQGAAVRLVDPCPTCYRPERAAALGPPGGPVTVAAATTDGAGSFAFINISPLPRLDLTVTKTGYGFYAVQGIHYSSDETYVTTVELGPTQQTYNEAGTKSDSTLTAASAGSGYDSNGRVPPSLQVAQFPQAFPSCAPAGSLRRVRRYPWRFYVLHTMSGEILGSGFPGRGLQDCGRQGERPGDPELCLVPPHPGRQCGWRCGCGQHHELPVLQAASAGHAEVARLGRGHPRRARRGREQRHPDHAVPNGKLQLRRRRDPRTQWEHPVAARLEGPRGTMRRQRLAQPRQLVLHRKRHRRSLAAATTDLVLTDHRRHPIQLRVEGGELAGRVAIPPRTVRWFPGELVEDL